MQLTEIKNDPIQCVIVDDDPFMQDLLRDKLSHFPNLVISAVASSGQEAIQKIGENQPDLVFLDVELPDLTGFEILEKLNKIDFNVIFVTSYSHYAIKAIRSNALDYILKPIDLQELKNAIKRFEINRSKRERQIKNDALHNSTTTSSEQKLLTVNLQDGPIRLPLKDILYLEGDRNYSYIHTIDGNKTLVSKTLAALEDILEKEGFFRCHKSYIVNRLHLKGDLMRDSIVIQGGKKIPVSRRKSQTFKGWLAKT